MLANMISPSVLRVVVRVVVVELVPMPSILAVLLLPGVMEEIIGTCLVPTRLLMVDVLMSIMLLIKLTLAGPLLTIGPCRTVENRVLLLLDRLIVNGLRVPTRLMSLWDIPLASITWIILTVLGAAICNLFPNLDPTFRVPSTRDTRGLLLRIMIGRSFIRCRNITLLVK